MRVSSSAETDERTNSSDTCCVSTSTVAVARYRSGSDTVTLTAAAKTAPKTSSDSVFRRRHTSNASSKPFDCLWDEDDITRVHADVLLAAVLLRGQRVVPDRDARRSSRLLPEDDDPVARGKFVETARHG